MPENAASYNLFTQAKWLLNIPFKKIDPSQSLETFSLNLNRFTIPSLSVKKTGASYLGYFIPISTTVRDDSKEITFHYMLSSDWHQFMFLYKWLQMMLVEGADKRTKMSDYLLDLTVTILSEFKEPIINIKYYGCWINELGDLDLDYQNPESKPIHHHFTCSYSYYIIEDLRQS